MSVKENRSGRQTKEWILDTACRLFNTYGTQAISTKRIAKDMGISPGNLYYHFNNKEEIILALFEASKDLFMEDWDNHDIPPIQRFWSITQDVMAMWRDCTFFKKEMRVLMQNDPKLKQRYQEMSANIRKKAESLFQDLTDAGKLQLPDTPELFDSLLNISVIIANNWLTHLEMNDVPLSSETLQHGAELILLVWQPYLTEEALGELHQLRETQLS